MRPVETVASAAEREKLVRKSAVTRVPDGGMNPLFSVVTGAVSPVTPLAGATNGATLGPFQEPKDGVARLNDRSFQSSPGVPSDGYAAAVPVRVMSSK